MTTQLIKKPSGRRGHSLLRPVVALLAVGLIASVAAPARAGDASWDSPAGDATEFFTKEFRDDAGLSAVPGNTPLPSNDALDVIHNSLKTVDAEVVWRVKVKQMPATGYPPHSSGYFFRMSFTFGDEQFQFRVGEDITAPATHFSFRTRGRFEMYRGSRNVVLECAGCTGAIDRKTSSIIITAPIASIAAGIKKQFPDLPAFGPGAELTRLEAKAQRWMGASLMVTADTAKAPAELVYEV